MADQRNFARNVMAVSSVVVAACAVAVTIKVLSTDIISVEQPRVLDQAALERQVSDEIRGLREEPVDRLACPASVVVKVGNEFNCRYWDGPNPKQVRVEITNDQGEISVETTG
ncbi:DUF4333 domain-containing protein [Saccharopolyspora shandongensis]|uniref:DUF4333 domain-containing protein n=1 Tax=Saccharopolyspora shandongensis TaxID=418495 RepID=UPI003435C8EA